MSKWDGWRPLGVETDTEVAAYDALHDGITEWMKEPFWDWVKLNLVSQAYDYDGFDMLVLDNSFVLEMSQILQIPVIGLTVTPSSSDWARNQINKVVSQLMDSQKGLQIADYILAFKEGSSSEKLEEILFRSKSKWTIGERYEHLGLIARVPMGVKDSLDIALSRSSRAGRDLAQAWEDLYGLNPDPSNAYRLSVRAVENAAIPIISPNNTRATLGTVIRDMENQKRWKLPLSREDSRALSSEVLLKMMKMLWVGQHDRHGGQSDSTAVSIDEATAAVAVATTLVHLFDAKLVTSTRA